MICINRKEPGLLKLQERSTLTLRKASSWRRWWSTMTSKRREVKMQPRCVFLQILLASVGFSKSRFWVEIYVCPLLQAAGKYRQLGRNYVVDDGDIIFFKFNTPNAPKKKPWDDTIPRGRTQNTVKLGPKELHSFFIFFSWSQRISSAVIYWSCLTDPNLLDLFNKIKFLYKHSIHPCL